MNTIGKFKQIIQVLAFITLPTSQALAENLSHDNKQDHVTTLNENNTDSIIAVVREIVDQKSQLEIKLKEIETEIVGLKKGVQTIINNEEGLSRGFSEEEIKQIEEIKSIIEKTMELVKEKNGVKEEIASLEQQADLHLKQLEDAARFRYLASSNQTKD